MTVSSGSVTIKKDANNLIGISIGGGAPLCPCLYIVQIFDNTAASRDGTLQSGDELVSINGQSVKGKTKVEVAKMIQSTKVHLRQHQSIVLNLYVYRTKSLLTTISCMRTPAKAKVWTLCSKR